MSTATLIDIAVDVAVDITYSKHDPVGRAIRLRECPLRELRLYHKDLKTRVHNHVIIRNTDKQEIK